MTPFESRLRAYAKSVDVDGKTIVDVMKNLFDHDPKDFREAILKATGGTV